MNRSLSLLIQRATAINGRCIPVEIALVLLPQGFDEIPTGGVISAWDTPILKRASDESS